MKLQFTTNIKTKTSLFKNIQNRKVNLFSGYLKEQVLLKGSELGPSQRFKIRVCNYYCISNKYFLGLLPFSICHA